MLVTRNWDGHLTSSNYRKPTHRDQYNNNILFTPFSDSKHSIVMCLYNWTKHLITVVHLWGSLRILLQKKHLSSMVLVSNAYPNLFVIMITKTKTSQKRTCIWNKIHHSSTVYQRCIKSSFNNKVNGGMCTCLIKHICTSHRFMWRTIIIFLTIKKSINLSVPYLHNNVEQGVFSNKTWDIAMPGNINLL